MKDLKTLNEQIVNTILIISKTFLLDLDFQGKNINDLYVFFVK